MNWRTCGRCSQAEPLNSSALRPQGKDSEIHRNQRIGTKSAAPAHNGIVRIPSSCFAAAPGVARYWSAAV